MREKGEREEEGRGEEEEEKRPRGEGGGAAGEGLVDNRLVDSTALTLAGIWTGRGPGCESGRREGTGDVRCDMGGRVRGSQREAWTRPCSCGRF